MRIIRVLKVFFLGVVIGWLSKWLIDEIFSDDRPTRMAVEEHLLSRENISRLEEPKSVQRAPAATTAQNTSGRDNLKVIKGVGPAMEKKLNDAGITTFEQLSRLTSTDLGNILGLSKRVTQNADNLITQARRLAQEEPKG